MKRNTIAYAALLLTAWLFGQAAGGQAAGAHDWGEWFGYGRWTTTVIQGQDTDKTVQWKFVDNFPTTHRAAVQRAAARWNGMTTMDFDDQSADAGGLGWGNCPTTYQLDRVGWQDIPPGSHGQTYLCTFSSTAALWSFTMRLDSIPTYPWYSGIDGNVPITHMDTEASAAHEFGHATGRTTGGDGGGHFGDDWSVCPGDWEDGQPYSGRHTMCQSIDPGRSAQRTLETHDLDIFQGAY